MATIQTFEEIVSWQEARLLNQKIGTLIDTRNFKSSFKLINQIEFEDLSTHAKKISSLIQKLISYLESSETKGIKYKNRSNN